MPSKAGYAGGIYGQIFDVEEQINEADKWLKNNSNQMVSHSKWSHIDHFRHMDGPRKYTRIWRSSYSRIR